MGEDGLLRDEGRRGDEGVVAPVGGAGQKLRLGAEMRLVEEVDLAFLQRALAFQRAEVEKRALAAVSSSDQAKLKQALAKVVTALGDAE